MSAPIRLTLKEAIEFYIEHTVHTINQAFRANKNFDYFEEWELNIDEDKVFEWHSIDVSDTRPRVNVDMKKKFKDCDDHERRMLFSHYLMQTITEICDTQKKQSKLSDANFKQ